MTKQKIYKFSLTTLLAVCGLLTYYSTARAGEFNVISVVRSLPLKNDDSVVKDYYINAGTNNGLVNGAFLDALRKNPVYDNTTSKVISDTWVPVAKLKIIHVDKNVAVARLVRMLDRAKTPVSHFEEVAIGDHIRVSESQ